MNNKNFYDEEDSFIKIFKGVDLENPSSQFKDNLMEKWEREHSLAMVKQPKGNNYWALVFIMSFALLIGVTIGILFWYLRSHPIIINLSKVTSLPELQINSYTKLMKTAYYGIYILLIFICWEFIRYLLDRSENTKTDQEFNR